MSNNKKGGKQVEKTWIDSMEEWTEWITYELPPGKPIIPQYWYCNLHKGSMPVLLFAWMVYYDNWSLGAWMYFALHGSYGALWILKDFTFPDKAFQRKVTLMSFAFPWPVSLLPYCTGGYLMMSGQAPQDPSPERVALCTVIYVFGIVLMMGYDG